MKLDELTIKYFQYFSTKNMKGLENEMYADNVHLRDWNGEWRGKFAVLEMNENLFQTDFELHIEDMLISGNTTITMFNLHIANTQYKVVDIITWNDSGKIEKILAYNG